MHLLVDSALIADFYFYFKKTSKCLLGTKLFAIFAVTSKEEAENP